MTIGLLRLASWTAIAVVALYLAADRITYEIHVAPLLEDPETILTIISPPATGVTP